MRLGVIGMTTRDTYMHVPGARFANEGVTLLEAVTRTIGGKGYLMAQALGRVVEPSQITLCTEVGEQSTLLSELTAFDSAAVSHCLDTDSEVWVLYEKDFATTLVRPGRLLSGAKSPQQPTEIIETSDFLYLTAEREALIVEAANILGGEAKAYGLNPCEPLIAMFERSGRTDVLKRLIEGADLLICNVWEERRLLKLFGNRTWEAATEASELVVTAGAEGGRLREAGELELGRVG